MIQESIPPLSAEIKPVAEAVNEVGVGATAPSRLADALRVLPATCLVAGQKNWSPAVHPAPPLLTI